MKKQFLILLVFLAALIVFAACSKEEPAPDTDAAIEETESDMIAEEDEDIIADEDTADVAEEVVVEAPTPAPGPAPADTELIQSIKKEFAKGCEAEQ